MKTLFLGLILLSLTGCTSTSKLVRELAKDPATMHLRVMSAWVNIELDRTNPRTNSVSHSIDEGKIRVNQP